MQTGINVPLLKKTESPENLGPAKASSVPSDPRRLTPDTLSAEIEISATYKWLLRSAVMVGGAAVMIIEILGSRILAPSFGTTLHVWSALITVTLAALAIGYAFGGRVADRKPGLESLMWVMACAAGTILLSDLMAKPVLNTVYSTGIISGTFIAAILLFLPTLFLLGMISPMAVRAAANHYQSQSSRAGLNQLGTSVGNLYALSTIGSVVGSLCVSLILIPNVTVRVAIISTAVALALIPICYFFLRRRILIALMLLIGLLPAVAITKSIGDSFDSNVLYRNEYYPVTARIPSAYGDLVVSDYKGARFLFLNGVQQGSLIGDVSQAKYIYGLQRLATVKGIPKKMLIWGLGPGVLARVMAEAGAEVSVIDIDPTTEKVARKYFGLPSVVDVRIGDARIETKLLNEKYDVIVLDAFSGDTPPFHLLTREAFRGLRDRLAPDGLVIANFVGGTSGSAAIVGSSIVLTMENVFGKTLVFSPNWQLSGRKPNYVSTMFLVAGQLPEKPAPFTMKVSEEISRLKYIEAVLESRIELPRDDAVILTDDFAPIEAWSDMAVQAMRH